MSVEAKASCTTSCATDTDDGDYETSSEGPGRGSHRRPIPNKSKDDPRSEAQKIATPWKPIQKPIQESIQEPVHFSTSQNGNSTYPSNVLAKSESMPVLKTVSREEDEESLTLTSESSLARERKMKMIIAKMSSDAPSECSLSTSRAGGADESYVAKKTESRTILPVLRNEKDHPTRSKEVSFQEEHEEGSCHSQRKKPARISRDTRIDDDLIDIAENSHPSIKSFYFPPNPQESFSRKQQRVTKDLDALLRIDGELGPLQHQLSEITGKFRALNLTDVPLNLTASSLLGHNHCGSRYAGSSGYHLRKAETFGRDSFRDVSNFNAGSQFTVARRSSRESKATEYPDAWSSRPVARGYLKETNSKGTNIENGSLYSLMRPRKTSNLGQDWTVHPNDSTLTMNNSLMHFENRVEKNPSGSLIPSVSSSCYRCHKNRAYASYFDYLEAGGSKGNIVTDFGPGSSNCQPRKEEPIDQQTTSKATGSEVHVISVNTELRTTVAKHYVDANSCFKESSIVHKDCMTNPEFFDKNTSFHCPKDKSVSTSVTLIESTGGNKTHYLNYTRVDSQTSLIISKKDQSVETSHLDLPGNTVLANSQAQKQVKDLDVQCSGFNLKYQKEIVLRRSVESILKPSESEESSASSKITGLPVDEKIVIVPIVFTDGIPEPQRLRLPRSKGCLLKSKQHVIRLRREASCLTNNSLFSKVSTESCAMESSYSNQKSTNCNSRTSCGSRNTSSQGMAISQSSEQYQRSVKGRSMASGNSRASSDPAKKGAKRVIRGMTSSPEDFLLDT